MFSTVRVPGCDEAQTVVLAECLALLTNAIVCWITPFELAEVSTRAGTSLR